MAVSAGLTRTKNVILFLAGCILIYVVFHYLFGSWKLVAQYCVPANEGLSLEELNQRAREFGLSFRAISSSEYIVSGGASAGPDSPICKVSFENGVAKELLYEGSTYSP